MKIAIDHLFRSTISAFLLAFVLVLGLFFSVSSPALAQDCCTTYPYPFTAIRIGDQDGFGFGDGKGLTAASGGPVNLDGKGVLTVQDFLPDFNGDNKISNRDGGDPFDNRSDAEVANTLTTGEGFIDTGSKGSDYTDLSLGKSFGYKSFPTHGHPFPDGDPEVPNNALFEFRFKVAKDKLPKGTPLFLNMMYGDFDVKTAQVIHKDSNYDKMIGQEVQASPKDKEQDGIIMPVVVPLEFSRVFSDGDANGESGYWIGFLNAKFKTSNDKSDPCPDNRCDPYLAFDFAEISTTPISLQPCPAKDYKGKIQGLKWDDINGNGKRETLVVGNPPDVVFVIDVSGSTENGKFQGSSVGDLNNDGQSDDIIDGEIAGFIALNEQIIQQGYGDTGKVAIVSFNGDAYQADMDPSTPGPQLATAPAADNDNNGIPDVQDVLSSLQGRGYTYYSPALKLAQSIIQSLNTPTGKANVVFISDGEPNNPDVPYYPSAASSLRNANVNVTAFGAGSGATLPTLQKVDPRATIFTSIDELLNVFSGRQGTTSSSSSGGLEPVLPNVTIYLDLNDNGALDASEPSQVTDVDGLYQFTDLAPGDYVVREVVEPGFTQTAPAGGFAKITLGEDEVVSDVNFGNQK
ncbi:MAG: VWA domain-containing protein [Oscillatoria sp. SIO1A7]|nr:VWA domain-containing protein [Oscillatoria sp. SIO1A7]